MKITHILYENSPKPTTGLFQKLYSSYEHTSNASNNDKEDKTNWLRWKKKHQQHKQGLTFSELL